MKFYKPRTGHRAPNEYFIRHKDFKYGAKSSITLYHCYLKNKTAEIQPSSFNVSREELKWNFIECGELECNKVKSVMY